MIFRLSKKLCAKIMVGALSAQPPDENPYADWSAHLFTADRTQYILLSNTKSLYSTVIYAKGITQVSQFIDRALNSIREFTQDDGQQFVYDRFIASAAPKVSFARALNRTVTGSMNELVFQAIMLLTEDGLSPHEVGFRLNDILISSLPGLGGYGRPREAFKALLNASAS